MFRLPPATKYLLIGNIAIYFIGIALAHTIDFNSVFGLHFLLAPNFQIYQLVTYMFMHGGLMHLFFNMFALWMFGCVVEMTLGTKRFVFFYLVCGIGAGLFQEAAQLGELIVTCKEQLPGFKMSELLVVAHNSAPMLSLWTTVGASGAIYAILLAFGLLYPEQRIFIFPLPIPIKAKWFVIIYAAIELFYALSTTSDGVAHVAHLGGMVFGYFLIRYWRRHPYGMGSGRAEREFFSRMKDSWERRQQNGKRRSSDNTYVSPEDKRSDWDYNAQQRRSQEEIDAILDKIRKNGYDSLTLEEKQKLFDSSNKK